MSALSFAIMLLTLRRKGLTSICAPLEVIYIICISANLIFIFINNFWVENG